MKKKEKKKSKDKKKVEENKILKEKIEKEQYKAVLRLCEKKYDEENYREKAINTKAGFLLTVLSILISILINLLIFVYDIQFKYKELVACFISIISILLIVSLGFAIYSQKITNRLLFPKIKKYIETLNNNNQIEKYATDASTINMYIDIIEDKHYKIEKNAKNLNIAFNILFISLILSVLFCLTICLIGGLYE